MNCPKCHYALSPFEAACPRCAQMRTAQNAAAAEPATRPALAYHAAPEPVTCAACGNTAIQKVSGLYQGGVWSAEAVGVGVGYGRTSSGQSFTTVSTSHAVSAGRTGLAQALAPPPRPGRFQTPAEKRLTCATSIAALVWFLGYAVLVGTSNSSIPHSSLLAYWIISSAITLVPLAAIPTAVHSVREQKAHLVILLQRWQAVLNRWDCLYYCPRCDRVFNAQTGQHAPTHAANGLLCRDILNGTSTL